MFVLCQTHAQTEPELMPPPLLLPRVADARACQLGSALFDRGSSRSTKTISPVMIHAPERRIPRDSVDSVARSASSCSKLVRGYVRTKIARPACTLCKVCAHILVNSQSCWRTNFAKHSERALVSGSSRECSRIRRRSWLQIASKSLHKSPNKASLLRLLPTGIYSSHIILLYKSSAKQAVRRSLFRANSSR